MVIVDKCTAGEEVGLLLINVLQGKERWWVVVDKCTAGEGGGLLLINVLQGKEVGYC